MASIANASDAYVSAGNGNAYQIGRKNYIPCMTINGNPTFVWKDNNDGTATITGTIDNTAFQVDCIEIIIIAPANITTGNIQSIFVNGNQIQSTDGSVRMNGFTGIYVTDINSRYGYSFAPAGTVANVTININSISYRTLNF